jgi:hypothetical protein
VHRNEYEQGLVQIMGQHEVQDEFELVTGCIVNWDKLHKKRTGKQYDKKSRIVEAVQGLRKKFFRYLPPHCSGESMHSAVASPMVVW